jgi:hypothetical protein
VINVTALNRLGSLEDVLFTDVMYDVRVLKSDAEPVTLGNPTVIELELSGTREFTIGVNYSDGHEESAVTSPNSTFFTEVAPVSVNAAPLYRALFSHVFNSTGTYQSVISIENHVSRAVVMLTVAIGEELSDVSLTTNATSHLLPVGSSVMVTASVESGDDLHFTWLCDKCLFEPQVKRFGNIVHYV